MEKVGYRQGKYGFQMYPKIVAEKKALKPE